MNITPNTYHSSPHPRSSTARNPKPDSSLEYFVSGDPKKQSNLGQTGSPAQKFSSKTRFHIKDPKARGDPETDPVALLILPSGMAPTTPGIGRLTVFSNIDAAVSACKEEKSDLIRGWGLGEERVRGNLYDEYCDVSGYVCDLVRLREFGIIH